MKPLGWDAEAARVAGEIRSMDADGYRDFLKAKVPLAESFGFEIADDEVNPILKPHQRAIVRWMVAGGRRACFAAFGLGKSVIQLDIDPPGARVLDAATSHAAARAARELQAEHHGIILAALRKGPAGKDRIAAMTSLSGVQVARRTIELQRAGLIRLTGNTVMSTAGRAEREWCLA